MEQFSATKWNEVLTHTTMLKNSKEIEVLHNFKARFIGYTDLVNLREYTSSSNTHGIFMNIVRSK